MFLHLLRPGPSQPLTVRNVTNLIEPEFSEDGSNISRTLENAVYAKFIKYIREAASKSNGQMVTFAIFRKRDALHTANSKGDHVTIFFISFYCVCCLTCALFNVRMSVFTFIKTLRKHFLIYCCRIHL